MPSWSIHLSVAKKVNEKLKIDKDLFYLGNLIADIDYNNKLSRKETHFYYDNPCKKCSSENLPNIEMFLNEYKNKLNNPLILGYYSHILTDYFYNNYIYSNCWIQNNNEVIGIKLKNGKIIKLNSKDNALRKKYKQHDLILYGKYLFNNNCVEIPNYPLNINKSLDLLKNNFYKEEDIQNRVNYLHNDFYKINKLTLKEKIFGYNYKLFYKEELDSIYDKCIKFVLSNILKNDRRN